MKLASCSLWNSIGRLPRVSLQSTALTRNYGWSPFRKRATQAPVDEEVEDVIIEATQELRGQPDQARLKELMWELIGASSKNESFALMNSILKKLDTNSHEDSRSIIPTFTLEETYTLFHQVIADIDAKNYTSARFIPRLYLQLMTAAKEANKKELMLDTFTDFVKYLSVLGYGEQLSQIIESFVKENPKLLNASFRIVQQVLSQQQSTHPVILIKVFKVYEWLGLKSKSLDRSAIIILESMITYFRKRNSLFSIEKGDMDQMKEFLKSQLEKPQRWESLLKIINVCDLDDHFQSEKTKSAHALAELLGKNTRNYFDAPQMKTISKTIMSSDEFSYREKKKILQSISSSVSDIGATKETLDNSIQLMVFNSSGVTPSIRELLLKNSQFVDNVTLESITLALSNAKQLNFSTTIEKAFEFFDENFPDVDKTTTLYNILMINYIRLGDRTQLRRCFDESINNGINWRTDPEVLFKFLKCLAEDPNADSDEVFRWYKRVKFFVEYLDSSSYSAMVNLFLKNNIQDVVASMDYEFPPLEGGKKFQKDNYPELFESIYQWMLNDSEDPADVWDLYNALQKFFDLPYDTYFPLMKRFVDMGRADASFLIFQQLKKLHRTTGTVPPPSSEMYCYLFRNFGKVTYTEGVETLYLILKLDLHVNTDINIMNSVMDAFCNLQDLQRVSDIFDQIITMPHKSGLNHETVSIMMRSYTLLSLEHVKHFWNHLDKLNILPNSENFNQYIISHCYYEQYEEALQIAASVEEFGVPMTPQIIESLYKLTENQEMKSTVQEWAEKEYPQIWTSLGVKLIEGEKSADSTITGSYNNSDSGEVGDIMSPVKP